MKIGDRYKIHHEFGTKDLEIFGIRNTFLGKMVYFKLIDKWGTEKEGYSYTWWFKYRTVCKL